MPPLLATEARDDRCCYRCYSEPALRNQSSALRHFTLQCHFWRGCCLTTDLPSHLSWVSQVWRACIWTKPLHLVFSRFHLLYFLYQSTPIALLLWSLGTKKYAYLFMGDFCHLFSSCYGQCLCNLY